MKLLIAALSTFSLFAFSDAARATPSADKIFNHSVVVGVVKLLTAKYGNKCEIPSTENDIRWMCLGDIPPVTTAEIDATGCGFAVEIVCPGETVSLFGSTHSYYLNSPTPTQVKPVDAGISIDSIDFH